MLPAIMTRRQFNGRLTKAALLARLAMATEVGGALIALEGCGLASDIETWVPVGKAAMQSIELVLQQNGFPLSAEETLIFNGIIAALTALDNAAIAYGKTNPPPVGTLQELQAAFNAVTAQLATFFQTLALPEGNVLSLIVGFANIIIDAILGFENQVPPAPAGARTFTMSVSYRVASRAFTAKPKVYKHPREFKSDWNHMADTWARVGVAVPAQARFGWFESHF
jgi:hypothetical protein